MRNWNPWWVSDCCDDKKISRAWDHQEGGARAGGGQAPQGAVGSASEWGTLQGSARPAFAVAFQLPLQFEEVDDTVTHLLTPMWGWTDENKLPVVFAASWRSLDLNPVPSSMTSNKV